MKHTRILGICLACLLTVLLFGCAPEPTGSASLPAAASGDVSHCVSTPPSEETTPIWPQTTLETWLDGLNLDGNGTADDTARVFSCRFGDFGGECTVLQVLLGTGETLAEILPVHGSCTLQTASLFSPDKQALLLEVEVPNSNYGAARVFVFDVFPADPWPSVVTRLDTTAQAIRSASGELFPFTDQITAGTKAVDVGGSTLSGIVLSYIDPNDKWSVLRTTLVWRGDGAEPNDGWAIAPE